MDKRLYIYAVIIVAVVCVSVLIFDVILDCQPTDVVAPPDNEYYAEIVSETAVDKFFTPPDTYEVLYRITYSNGLTVEIRKTVSREEYENTIITAEDQLYRKDIYDCP